MSTTRPPTLADRISKSAANDKIDRYTRGMLIGAAREIAEAQRFVMTEDVRDAVQSLMIARPSTLLSACAFARPPFTKVWLEWPTPDQPEPISDVRVKTTAIGAMLEAVNPTSFRFFTCWSYETNDTAARWAKVSGDPEFGAQVAASEQAGLGVSALEIGVDFSYGSTFSGFGWETSPGVSSMTDAQLARLRNDDHNAVRFALKDPREREALVQMERAIRWRVRPNTAAIDQVSASIMFGKKGTEAAFDDVRDEIGPVISMLILLNSRNCVQTERWAPPPLPEKLVKARKKRGMALPRQPLDHTIVHIKLSKTQTNVANARGMTHAERRRHLCAGHFKLRKSGVFWWNPHFRGSEKAGTVRKEKYVVRV